MRPDHAPAEFCSFAGRAMARNEGVTGLGRGGMNWTGNDVAKPGAWPWLLRSEHSVCGELRFSCSDHDGIIGARRGLGGTGWEDRLRRRLAIGQARAALLMKS